jgi:hypothetical protein
MVTNGPLFISKAAYFHGVLWRDQVRGSWDIGIIGDYLSGGTALF